MAWQQLICCLNTNDLPTLETLLEANGVLSITIEDAEDHPIFEPAPGEMPLWETTIIKALFEAEQNLAALIAQIRQSDWITNFTLEPLADQPWERAWLEHFKPVCFGHGLWVSPHGHTVPDKEATIVWLDPGLAFGTGTHPTTALCLEWLAKSSLQGKTVVDFGCGSGILAIAAAKLGALRVVAIDIDPQALTATRNNAVANQCEHLLDIALPEDAPRIKADIVVANILANTLVELQEAILSFCAPQAQLAMSGILQEQEEQLRQAYAPFAANIVSNQQGDWVCLSATVSPPLVNR